MVRVGADCEGLARARLRKGMTPVRVAMMAGWLHIKHRRAVTAPVWRMYMSISAISSGLVVARPVTPTPPTTSSQAAAPAPARKPDGDGDHGVEPARGSAAAKSSASVQAALTTLSVGG